MKDLPKNALKLHELNKLQKLILHDHVMTDHPIRYFQYIFFIHFSHDLTQLRGVLEQLFMIQGYFTMFSY